MLDSKKPTESNSLKLLKESKLTKLPKLPIKIYILAESGNWISGQFVSEWKKYSNKSNYIYTSSYDKADIIWILNDYLAKQIPINSLKGKKVITTIHHIVPWKMDNNKIQHFKYLDLITEYFITIGGSICANTLKKYITKPIRIIPFWNNENQWRFLGIDKSILRMKYNIPNNINDYIIGSFQRDTEGNGIPYGIYEPKREKGPDLLIKAIIACKERIELQNENYLKKITVLLTGTRRHYIIDQLNKHNISYIYIEMCNLKVLNELYNCLDLYLVTSRVEGGPRAINEAALTRTPLLTTNVGIANLLCHPNSIIDINNIEKDIKNIKIKPDIDYNYNKSQLYTIENYMDKFNELMFI